MAKVAACSRRPLTGSITHTVKSLTLIVENYLPVAAGLADAVAAAVAGPVGPDQRVSSIVRPSSETKYM